MPPLSQRFAEKRAVYRDTEFVLREIDAETFDSCMKKATTTTFKDDGSEEETVDQRILVRSMLIESLIKPKWTPADINKQGFRLVSQLERDVRELHFDNEPQTKTPPAESDDDGGNPKGV